MEHLVSDAKNIKESFYCMQKYILNKKIEGGKANDINNLKDIGEATWDFIFSLYNLGWDEFIADNDNLSFRHKVKAQFDS